MRAWFIVGLLLIGINQLIQKHPDKPNSNQAVGKQHPAASAKPPVAGVGSPDAQPKSDMEDSGAGNRTKHWYEELFSATVANWALFFAALGGIYVGLKTLKVIARQAVSMRRQTTILRRSVDATIASERAWVMVDLEKVPGVGFLVDGTSPDGSHYVAAAVRCICSNQGKTPAKISEKRIGLSVTTPNKPLSIEPDLDIEIFDPAPHYLQSGQASTKDWTPSGRGERILGNTIVIYGVVKYRHIFSDREIQTTFGYRLTESDKLERLSGYPKYNENV